jgi:RNA polymerase sigma-70 factor, ECF subfamily
MQMAIPFNRCMFEQDFLRHLIREAKAGDDHAFERIVTAHEHMVLRFAQRLLLNRDAAKDAAQETFLRLYRNLLRVDETRDLSGWLYRTTSNICCDILRRTKQDLPIDLSIEPADGRPNPEESMNAVQQKRLVMTALKQLSAREREVIALRDLEGHSTAEVAHILNISEGTVRSQLSTGRVKLKNFVTTAVGRQL